MNITITDITSLGIRNTKLENMIKKLLEKLNLIKPQKPKLVISDVMCSYNDVEKWCDENGYYIGTYWFPNR